MSWFRKFVGRKPPDSTVKSLQDKFSIFMLLLEKNNQVLEIMSDMEEKFQSEYLFDLNYIRGRLGELRTGVWTIVEGLIALGGEKYSPLREKYREIDVQIESMLPGSRLVERDDYVIPLEGVCSDRAGSVGNKNAQLGELKRIGLPVPDGFAVSAWAYRHFVSSNDLQNRISELLSSLDLKSYDDLVRISNEIRGMIHGSPVPLDLERAIMENYRELTAGNSAVRVALRSSAIGEDTFLSFAGQYATLLNVGEQSILDGYRKVLASKFSPKAIYYFLSHGLSEPDLAMSVGCMVMVDAVSSGVIYTRDPVSSDKPHMIVNSIFGLGASLIDGKMTPDVFRIDSDNSSLLESCIARKPVQLALHPQEGVIEEIVQESMQGRSSLSKEQLARLYELAVRIEQHYGSPQDIEWAVGRDGGIYLLQTRPLRVLPPARDVDEPDLSAKRELASGGTTVCPGAGCGEVFHVKSVKEMAAFPEGAVLVAPHPFPGLITAMKKASAIVTEVGGSASHMATIAREYRIPALAGVENAIDLPEGEEVTVDASFGRIFAGAHQDLVEARRPDYDLFKDSAVFDLLGRLLSKISPLNLINPGDPDFTPEKCRTFHDITRFAHQKAMDEMFSKASRLEDKERIGFKFKSSVPLAMNVIYLDMDRNSKGDKKWIDEKEITSLPMKAFWEGVKKEGWVRPERPVDVKGFLALVASSAAMSGRVEYSENSFVILSKEYMIMGLFMGYHFSTIEALCTNAPSKNFIRMQYKEGGASFDRRIRRVRLIAGLCSKMGFENYSKADFLYAKTAYQSTQAILDKLFLLGRLTVMTKQLDMSLSNDEIYRWYMEDISKKLGLKQKSENENEIDS